jgi:inorganic phosphate transporter, PiT family
MDTGLLLLIVVIVTALAFDFTNGFHDTANAMATSIATRALTPKRAVALSAVLNFAGAFISIKVATTIAEEIVDEQLITLEILFAALLGAILWNLLTWALGLPSSSSHALIGGIVGAALVAKGGDAVKSDGLVSQVLIPAALAPLLAGTVALLATFMAYRMRAKASRERADAGFRWGQLGSASLVSLAHGTNDAQKTMGVITLALIAHGTIDGGNVTIPLWVKLAAATALAVGTYVGGWRIIRTLGRRVTGDIEPTQGFTAESSGAAVILASSYYGFPLSTTHVTSGGVIGSGLGRRLAQVRWGLAARMASAWILTIPAAGAVAALAFEASDAIGEGSGALFIGIVGAVVATALFLVTQRRDRVTAETV